MGLKDEVVISGDPNEEEEEEEEVDLIDPMDTIKDECKDHRACEGYRAELDACNDRVNGRENTAETCTQELNDFLHCVDHCISKQLFNHLK